MDYAKVAKSMAEFADAFDSAIEFDVHRNETLDCSVVLRMTNDPNALDTEDSLMREA